MDATRAQDAGGTARPQKKSESLLDRRREKLQASQATAADAHSDVRRLDQQLESNDDNRREQETALQAALDRAAVLKKAIKASTKEAAKLRAARKEAGERAATAQQRVSAAEAKYDRAVLADMVRREKENDLLAHASTEIGALGPGHSA